MPSRSYARGVIYPVAMHEGVENNEDFQVPNGGEQTSSAATETPGAETIEQELDQLENELKREKVLSFFQ